MYTPFSLLDTRMDCGTREVALAQEVVELLALLGRANESDDLVELQLIEDVFELPVILARTSGLVIDRRDARSVHVECVYDFAVRLVSETAAPANTSLVVI